MKLPHPNLEKIGQKPDFRSPEQLQFSANFSTKYHDNSSFPQHVKFLIQQKKQDEESPDVERDVPIITPKADRSKINRHGLFADNHKFLKFAKREETRDFSSIARSLNSLTERLLQ